MRDYNDFLVGEFNSNMINVNFLGFDTIANNECLFRYSNNVKYALVQDNDETFILPQLEHFDTEKQAIDLLSKQVYGFDETDFENFKKIYFDKSLCKKQTLEVQMEKIFKKYNIHESFSIHFRQVMLIDLNLTEVIFKEMEKLSANLNESFNEYPIRIRIVQGYNDTSLKQYKSNKYENNFTLIISNFTEYKYAINLQNSYEFILKPFLNQNKLKLKNISDLFKRFYYLKPPIKPEHYVGKSMVSEKTETFTSPHWPYRSQMFFGNDYYLSHFRVRYELERKEASIYSLHFDYNYFFCYFLKIFNSQNEN